MPTLKQEGIGPPGRSRAHIRAIFSAEYRAISTGYGGVASAANVLTEPSAAAAANAMHCDIEASETPTPPVNHGRGL